MIKELSSSFIIPAILVVTLVLVKLTEFMFDVDFVQFGIFPRKVSGLPGILTYPFIHADWKHLFNNSTALFILGTMLYYSYREIASRTMLWVYLMSGVWLWMGGRSNFHIGASGIVYALFGFLFLSGVLRRDMKLTALSLLVVFLYGSLVWGVLPIDHSISYEGHLFGLLAGFVVAIVYRNQGPQKPTYSWELVDEEDVPEWFPDPENTPKPLPDDQPINIQYVYKKKDDTTDRN